MYTLTENQVRAIIHALGPTLTAVVSGHQLQDAKILGHR